MQFASRVSLLMAEEPTLPRLAWDPVTESFTKNQPRKRARHSSPPLSSDPAIFSSDDDPSAENYTQERRKKKYRGPWYRQIPASDSVSQDMNEHEPHKKTKRTFERQFDSGVFMGSDGTDVDEVMEGLESFSAPLPLRQSRITQKSVPLPPSQEELAQGHVQRCLEEGNETIDLSSRGLSTLSNATIRPLATFTRLPPVAEGVFYRLEPKLKVFLASNNLATLPGELFNLDRLTALSLRNNKLSELPPGIGNLHYLRELNISLNNLRYLPFEILDLFSDVGRLQNLQLHPNPFNQPLFTDQGESRKKAEPEITYKIGLGNRTRPRRGAINYEPSDRERRSWNPQWKVSFQARTDIRYLDINGVLVKGPAFPDQTERSTDSYQNSIPVADPSIRSEPPAPRGNAISRAPSLLEVALNACIRTSQFPILASLLPEDGPHYLPDLFIKAAAKKDYGGSQCTICKRNFIIARTEWIEWWEIAKVVEKKGAASAASPLRQMENERDVLESMVPLTRRGCSWLCVPEKIAVIEDDMIVDE